MVTMYKNLIFILVLILMTACASVFQEDAVPQDCAGEDCRAGEQRRTGDSAAEALQYVIGPGDVLQVFVWRNDELSTTVPVRPDGRISLPLVDDIQASNQTAMQLAQGIEKKLSKYIRDPKVSVIVTQFGGAYHQQVRVVGEVTRAQAIPHRQNMTVLDAMILVGGMTEFAAGNRAVIIRKTDSGSRRIKVKLKNLMKKGDVSQNFQLLPGDVLLVPESLF